MAYFKLLTTEEISAVTYQNTDIVSGYRIYSISYRVNGTHNSPKFNKLLLYSEEFGPISNNNSRIKVT